MVIILSGLASTGDSALCAGGSLITVDLYSKYVNPKASDADTLRMARFSVLGIAIAAVGVSLIPGITILSLFLFYGTLRSSTLMPTLVVLFKEKVSARGVFWGMGLAMAFGLRPVKIPHDDIAKAIETYRAAYPIGKLVEGKHLQQAANDEFSAEVFAHAPERILIVERDDVAEMLILNRFYFEHKTLVVSESKRPEPAFKACRQFLVNHPDIPVAIIHDVSRHGHGMLRRLMADRQWGLEGKNVKDLGLFPRDMDRLKPPVWMPGPGSASSRPPGPPDNKAGSSAENIQQGHFIPMDIASPGAMMGSVGLAMTMGAAGFSTIFYFP